MMFKEIEKNFVEMVGVIVLTSDFTGESQYQKGWLDGYTKGWMLMTGKSRTEFIDAVNARLEGSGKLLHRG